MKRSATFHPARLMRAVALMEALKGAIVFGAGFGLLALLHRDVRLLAEAPVTRLHTALEAHYVGIYLDLAGRATDATLWVGAALALAYPGLRAAEAYGLWHERRWASWLGAAGGAIYIPVEVYELWHKPGPPKVATLSLNIGVVAYLV